MAALRREAASWKAALAAELRKAAGAELADLAAFSRGAGGRLGRKVEDLADARTVAAALGEVRKEKGRGSGRVRAPAPPPALLSAPRSHDPLF